MPLDFLSQTIWFESWFRKIEKLSVWKVKLVLRKCTSIIRWLNFPWIEARSQIDQSCTAMQLMMTMTMMMTIVDHDDADGCGGNKNRGQRAARALRSVSAMQLIEHTDAICHKHHIRQLGVQESPPTRCPGRWAWLMPQTAVETFRVGQKPGAYRASRAQGGDSRGQISQMPPAEFEVTTKIGGDRRPARRCQVVQNFGQNYTFWSKSASDQKKVSIEGTTHLDWVHSYLLIQPRSWLLAQFILRWKSDES